MRILKNYIARGFIMTFLTALSVITFVVSLSVIFKLTDLLAKDVSARPILAIIGTSIPMAIVFALPLAGLVSSLLVFGRLSSDGEITAVKASGISLGNIISTPVLLSVLLAVISVYLQNELSPKAHYLQRRYISQMSIESIYKLFDEGRYITDWPGLSIYIGKRTGNTLKDVRVYDIRERGIKREILARQGTVSTDTNTLDIVMDLEGVTIKPFSKDIPDAAYCDRWPVRINKAAKRITYFATIKDMNLSELISRIQNTAAYHPELEGKLLDVQRMVYSFNLNKRMSYAMSCIAFILLGIPLGIRAHRKESSIGIVISLGVVMTYHILTLSAEYLVRFPYARADIALWIPVMLALFGGLWLLKKND